MSVCVRMCVCERGGTSDLASKELSRTPLPVTVMVQSFRASSRGFMNTTSAISSRYCCAGPTLCNTHTHTHTHTQGQQSYPLDIDTDIHINRQTDNAVRQMGRQKDRHANRWKDMQSDRQEEGDPQ